MTDKADLDRTLESFLLEHSEEKRKGFTLANLFLRIDEWERKQRALERRTDTLEEENTERDERVEEAHDRLDAHRTAIVEAKRRERHRHHDMATDGEFREELDTGQFDLVAIQREVNARSSSRHDSERVRALEAARKESATWWKRHAITVFTTIGGALIIAALTAIVTLALHR